MSKQLLIETRLNSLSLCEGVQSKTKGCLGTLKGPCADFVDPTRNQNFYSRKLWENVFKDPLVVESLEDKILIGELDHPGDRLETKATNACIVMTDYDFDDKNGVVNGTFDILDTPNGRILKSLLDYGCKIGVSSRGEGDVTTVDGINKVDEESYYFVAFDAVVLPAVKKAKPSLSESVQKRESLKSSLSEQIKSSTTKSELDLIKKVVEATNLPDVDSLLESINNKSAELEGTTSSSTLMDDLERSTSQVSSLIEENKSLKKEVTNCKSRMSKMIESRRRSSERLSRSSLANDELNGKYTDALLKLSLSAKRVESLERSNQELSSKIDRLNNEVRSNKNLLREGKSKISSLEESLVRSQKSCSEKDSKIASLEEEIKTISSEYREKLKEMRSKLSESSSESKSLKSKLNESRKLSKETVKNYVESQSKLYGIDCSHILESVNKGLSFNDAKKMLDEEVSRSDRYRSLPIVSDKLLNSNSQGRVVSEEKMSDEERQTLSFMEEFYNHN